MLSSLHQATRRSFSSLSRQTVTNYVAPPSSMEFPSFLGDLTTSSPSTACYSETSTIRSMEELIQEIPAAVSERKAKDTPPGSKLDPVMSLYRKIDLPTSEWASYAFVDSSRPYTRNLIATDNETFTLLLLCWNPGKESPIHDHPCDGCWLKVLEGSVQECRYDHDLKCIADDTYTEDQIAYITDNMGYHKIGNPSHGVTGKITVTLHLYAPPVHECKIWTEPLAGCTSQQAKCPHYSEYGHRLS